MYCIYSRPEVISWHTTGIRSYCSSSHLSSEHRSCTGTHTTQPNVQLNILDIKDWGYLDCIWSLKPRLSKLTIFSQQIFGVFGPGLFCLNKNSAMFPTEFIDAKIRLTVCISTIVFKISTARPVHIGKWCWIWKRILGWRWLPVVSLYDPWLWWKRSLL